MADLICAANGNLTAAATWALCNSAATQLASTTTIGVTTTVQATPTFVPGAVTVDAVALFFYRVTNSPTGTLTVELYHDTGSAIVDSVTINCSDLYQMDFTPGFPDMHMGNGVLFKFGSDHSLTGGDSYSIRVKRSTSVGNVELLRTSTNVDIQKLLRETGTQAPGAGDNMYVLGEWTGAATVTARNVTMNSTATTDYGTMLIGDNGKLSYGTTAATDYRLKLSGHCWVGANGTLEIGTTAGRIPADSTAWLEFDSTSLNEFGLWLCQGHTIKVGADNIATRAKLDADASAAATSLTTDVPTGWKNGGSVGIGSTSGSNSEAEDKALTADASGTTLTITAITNAHLGTGGTRPRQAELVYLFRNVEIKGQSTTNTCFVAIANKGTCEIEYAEFRYFGGNGTPYRGIDIYGGTGTISFTYCLFRDNSTNGNSYFPFFEQTYEPQDCTFQYNTFWKINANGLFLYAGDDHSGTVISDNWWVGGSPSRAANLGSGNVTFNNNIFSSVGSSSSTQVMLDADSRGSSGLAGKINNWDGNLSHSGGRVVFAEAVDGGTISNWTSWRGGDIGFYFSNSTGRLDLVNYKSWGCTLAGIYVSNANGLFHIVNPDIQSKADAGDSAVATGMYFTSGCDEIIVDGGNIGNDFAHSSRDVFVNSGQKYVARWRSVLLGSSTEFSGVPSAFEPTSVWSIHRRDQVDDTHECEFYRGKFSYDATTFNTAAPSLKMEPTFSNLKFESGWNQKFKCPVQDGQTVGVSVYVRKDGTYNGNQPRLIVKRNYSLGITADTVLDTMSVGADTWEQLTGTTVAVADDGVLEFVVDCDGTAGAVYVDDFTQTSSQQTTDGLRFWLDAEPVVLDESGGGGGGSGGMQVHPGMTGGMRG